PRNDDDDLSKYFPSSFGKKSNSPSSSKSVDAFSKTRRKEQEETVKSISSEQQLQLLQAKRTKIEGVELSSVVREDIESQEEENNEDEEGDSFDTLPVSHEIKLNDHYR
ncbi:3857_t:CDS:2, partial [Funneliformis geosporum]